MDGRERVTRAIEFAGPDRLPIRHILLPGALLHHGRALQALLARYPEDFSPTGYREAAEYGERVGEGQADAWGAIWVRESDEHKGLVVGHPLASWDDLDSYRFPDPLEAGDWSRVDETLRRERRGRYVLVDGDTLFQRMFYLRGYEALMLDLAEGRPEAAHLRDRIVDFMLRKVERWLGFPVDGFQFRDDWGTQQALMIAPDLWRAFYKPAYRRLFAAVRSAGKHVFFHSDGQIRAIIPDLIEIGAQAINPQVRVVGHDYLRREHGGRVCFVGDVDRQHVLPFGTPEEVAAYTRREIEALGSFEGGYIGCGELAGDVPLANAEAMLREFAGYAYSRPAGR
jgi:uroporphyrinogen decarboxylase